MKHSGPISRNLSIQFNVYAYAFGDGLVNALYAVYQDQPEGFQDKYFDTLRAGGSMHHSDLLAPFGLMRRSEILGQRFVHAGHDR